MPAITHIDTRIGELAALGTAFCWTLTPLFFEVAGRRIGSLPVNLIRLLLALLPLSLIAWAVRGVALPVDASAHAWLWLSISGLVGFVLGDMCLFRAFVVVGARLSSLVMTMVPPMAVLLGWLILGETLAPVQIVAIGLTVCGVALAVTERAPPSPHRPHARTGPGLLLALVGALGQAGGLVLSKLGMGEYGALPATQIRIFAGVAGYAVLFSAVGVWPRFRAAWRDPRAIGLSGVGALLGPVVGVTLSLYAVQHTATGVAACIMAMPPVLIIPVAALVYREPITVRGVAGALVALGGVILLFA